MPGNYPKEGYGASMASVNPVMPPPPPPPPHSPVQSSYVSSRSSVSPVTSHDLTHSVEHSIPNYSASSNIVHPPVPEALDLSYSDSSYQKHPDPTVRGNMNPMRAPAILPYQERGYSRDEENLSRHPMHPGKGYGLTYVHVNVSEDENLPGRSNVSPLQEHHLSNEHRAVPHVPHNVSQEKEQEEEERPILQLIGEQRPRTSLADDRHLSAHRGNIMDPQRSGMGILRETHQSEVQSSLANTISGGSISMPLEHRTRDDMRHVPTTHTKEQEIARGSQLNIPRKSKHKSSHHSHIPDYSSSGKVFPHQEPTKSKKSKKHKKSEKKSHHHKSSHHHHSSASAPTGIRKAIEYGTIPPTPPVTTSSSFNRVSQHASYNRSVSGSKHTATTSSSNHPTMPNNNRTPLSSSNVAPVRSNIESGKRLPPTMQKQQPQPQPVQSQVPKRPPQPPVSTTQKISRTIIPTAVVKEKPPAPKGLQIPSEEQLLKALTKEDSVDLSKGDGTGKHKCGRCGSGFHVRADLDMHLLVFHSLKKPKQPIMKPKTPNELEKLKQSNMKRTVDDILRMLPSKRKTGGVKGNVKVVSVSYRCQTCDITFMTLVGLEEHQYSNHKCRTCDFTVENKEQLQRHKIITHMCGICGHYFKKDESRKEHPCEENVCTICGERTESKEALLEHNSESHKCSGCRASFLHKADLIKHRLDKHGHRCEICGYHFKWKEGLKQHMLSTHGMKCVTCKARFTLKEELEEHILQNHKCNICSLFFKSAESLEKHKKFIHICNMCGKVFKERDKLTKHQYETHKCGLCNEIFKLTKDLEQHKRTIHKCCFCGVVFHSKHIQDNHPCETYKCPCGANYETEDELELHSTNNHFCSFCDTFFLMKDEFRTHRSTNHRCIICEAHYISKVNLDKHKDSDHKCKKCGAKPDYDKEDPNVCKCGEKFKGNGKECQPSVQGNGTLEKVDAKTGNSIVTMGTNDANLPVDAGKLTQSVGTDKVTPVDSATVAPISVVIKEQTYKYTSEGDEEVEYSCEFCKQSFPDGRRQRAHERACPKNNLEELKRLQDAAMGKSIGVVAAGNLPVQTIKKEKTTSSVEYDKDGMRIVREKVPLAEDNKNTPDNFDCVLCNMPFENQDDLDDHVRDVHLGPIFDAGIDLESPKQTEGEEGKILFDSVSSGF